MGLGALKYNTTGTRNSAVGYGALLLNTTGIHNTAVGYGALYLNTTGSRNSAVGLKTLRANTTGSGNTGVGYFALAANTTGAKNSAVGYSRPQAQHHRHPQRCGRLLSRAPTQTTGNDNIYLAKTAWPARAGRSRSGPVGTHTQATIAGINGQRRDAGGSTVLVNASGQLGTVVVIGPLQGGRAGHGRGERQPDGAAAGELPLPQGRSAGTDTPRSMA